eukprot:Phypoly_transcript_07788.p1 GENE.Phypoly_transcript_07788~~Phypoly_transcript_07788.p1  ORF type:complete len:439 (+),score=51.05 Phypoly_transcript_07788:166-1482(+)
MPGGGLLPPPSHFQKFLSRFSWKPPTGPRQKIIVLGTGWGAFRFIKSVDCNQYKVIVVSPRNHFLFTPLLASTTVGTLEFRSVVEPIRKTRQHRMEYYQAECTDINPVEKKVTLKGVLGGEPFEMKYDKLVVAVGARNNTFNIPGVVEHAFFLKELHHARAIRKRILNCFEQAAMPNISHAERERLLSFVVVGGGPTGIEFAAELDDFFWEDLNKAFPNIPVNSVRITLLEASNTVLSSFDASLSEYTIRTFRKRGIDLRTGSLVKEVKEHEVVLSDGTLVPFGLLVWSTGVAPQAFIKELKSIPKESHGRIVVDEYLQVKGVPDVYAIGDCAAGEAKALPATAQVAQQQAAYLAKAVNQMARKEPVAPFAYHYMGMLAYVGHYNSVFDAPKVKFHGFFAWVSWRSVYLTRLGSLKSKIQVPFEWFRTFVFGRDITSF